MRFWSFIIIPVIGILCLSLSYWKNEPKVIRHKLPDKIEMDNGIIFGTEFSGLCKVNNYFYLPSEKGGKLFQCELKRKELVVTNTFDLSVNDFEIEGVAHYNRNLYLLDEKKDSLFFKPIDELHKLQKKVCLDKSIAPNTGGGQGFEGITFVPEQKLAFLMRERTESQADINTQSELYIFDIETNDTFKFKDSVIFNVEKGYRTSDVFYESISNNKGFLYSLVTKYRNYNIVKHRVDFTATGVNFERIGNYEFSVYVNALESEYNTNLEGLVKDGEQFYIVSDNGNGDKKSAFIEIDSIEFK